MKTNVNKHLADWAETGSFKRFDAFLTRLFATVGICVVLFVNCYFGYDVFRQIRTWSYATTSGVITSSSGEWRYRSDGEGGSWRFELHLTYAYEVNGAKYSGTRYRYGQDIAFRRYGEHVLERFPAGAQVQVYYNPREASDAVLVTGIDGTELHMALMFAIPDVVVLLFLLWLAGFLGPKTPIYPQGGYMVEETGGCTRVVLERRVRGMTYQPLYGAGLVIILLSVAYLFLFRALNTVVFPSLVLMGGVWLSIAALAIVMYLYLQFIHERIITINSLARTITFPHQDLGFPSTVVPFSSIRKVAVKEITRKNKADQQITTFSPSVTYDGTNGRQRVRKLVEWQDQVCAESLAGFLRHRVECAA